MKSRISVTSILCVSNHFIMEIKGVKGSYRLFEPKELKPIASTMILINRTIGFNSLSEGRANRYSFNYFNYKKQKK